MRSVSVAALCAAMVSACLGPKEGRRIASDVESDVGGDATMTTTTPADTLSGTDITPPDCTVIGCDDGNPCTVDSCDPSSGVCSHSGVPARDVPACGPALCDDGDPCTVDSCHIEGDGCGNPTIRCEHAPVPGCGGINCDLDVENQCDDGDPCTTDSCSTTEGCVHAPTGDPDCVAVCAEAGALQYRELLDLPPGWEARVVSRVQVIQDTCLDVDIPCNCFGNPALGCLAPPEYVEGACGMPLPFSWVEGASCDICGSLAWCTPLQDTVDYVVWGVTSSGVGKVPVPVIPQQTVSFEVQDFCLHTNLVSLVGTYEGRLTIDGEELHFVGDMEVEEPGWDVLFVREARCENCPNWGNILSKGVMMSFDPHDGWVELVGFGADQSVNPFPMVSGRLYSRRNSLAGRIQLGDGDESIEARLELTRLAPGTPKPSNDEPVDPGTP